MNVASPTAKQTREPGIVVEAFLRLRGLSATELLDGESKVQSLSQPRHCLMWLLRDLTHLSYSGIGRVIGGRDVKTVTHGIGKVADRIASDPEFRAQVLQTRAYILQYGVDDPHPTNDAATVLARRVLLDDDSDADLKSLAVCMASVGAILRSGDLTDAEARSAAITIIRNGGRHA
jgi:hypothetical protein